MIHLTGEGEGKSTREMKLRTLMRVWALTAGPSALGNSLGSHWFNAKESAESQLPSEKVDMALLIPSVLVEY